MPRFDEHPGDDAWLELAQQVTSPATAAELQKHLDECGLCRRIYAIWIAASRAAEDEFANEPPERALRAVRAAFSLRRKLSLLDRLAMAATLVYDSFREPLPVGLRGGGSAARLLLHEAAGFTVDVRLEQEREGTRWITGQIVKVAGPANLIEGAGILFVNEERQPVAQTIANSEGEFQLELPNHPVLTAYIEVSDGSLISVPIPGADDRGVPRVPGLRP
jgi:hypothetical protein